MDPPGPGRVPAAGGSRSAAGKKRKGAAAGGSRSAAGKKRKRGSDSRANEKGAGDNGGNGGKARGRDDGLCIVLCSFAHKVGVPVGLDLYFDVRGIQSDAYQIPGYKGKTGRDPALAAKLWEDPSAQEMYENAKAATVQLLSSERSRGQQGQKQRLMLRVGIGCKSGRHRSVAVVERMRDEFLNVCRARAEHLDACIDDNTNHELSVSNCNYPRSAAYTCPTCNIEVSTAYDMNVHLNGKKHRKRLAKRAKRAKPNDTTS